MNTIGFGRHIISPFCFSKFAFIGLCFHQKCILPVTAFCYFKKHVFKGKKVPSNKAFFKIEKQNVGRSIIKIYMIKYFY